MISINPINFKSVFEFPKKNNISYASKLEKSPASDVFQVSKSNVSFEGKHTNSAIDKYLRSIDNQKDASEAFKEFYEQDNSETDIVLLRNLNKLPKEERKRWWGQVFDYSLVKSYKAGIILKKDKYKDVLVESAKAIRHLDKDSGEADDALEKVFALNNIEVIRPAVRNLDKASTPETLMGFVAKTLEISDSEAISELPFSIDNLEEKKQKPVIDRMLKLNDEIVNEKMALYIFNLPDKHKTYVFDSLLETKQPKTMVRLAQNLRVIKEDKKLLKRFDTLLKSDDKEMLKHLPFYLMQVDKDKQKPYADKFLEKCPAQLALHIYDIKDEKLQKEYRHSLETLQVEDTERIAINAALSMVDDVKNGKAPGVYL